MSPSKSTITALGERDIGPDGRQSFSLLLEYSFKQTEAGEVSSFVVLRFSLALVWSSLLRAVFPGI